MEMTPITLNEAKENLEEIVKQVLKGDEPAILCTAAGEQVVVLPLEDFDSWKETIYLLSNPANVAHLRKSVEEASTGKLEEKELLDA
jgi:antitoxin YefM